MRVLLPLPVVLPLLAAGLSTALHGHLRAQQVVGLTVNLACLAAAVVLLLRVDGSGIAVVQLGGWAAPAGISLVADRFAAIMLVISEAMVLVVLVYAISQLHRERETLYFHPVYLTLSAGVALSFLTGDLFNLFVAFEVMLTSSYVLLTLGASGGQVRSGMTYVVISLVASVLFVTSVALVYAATGTVNLAQLAERLADVPAGLRAAFGLLWLGVFGIKAAVFPLFFWLPDAYPTAPTPVTALFAGLLTKVGVYAIIRTQTLLFPTGGRPSGVLLFVAGATMLVGVLGAIAQSDIKRILSFHIVSQIGYMILGLGLFTLAGVAGAIYYIVHHIVVKTTLFLVAGIVETTAGTARLSRLGGLAHLAPVPAALFMLAALSLAGLPPFSGFVAKLALVQAGLALDRWWVIGVSLLVSLLTLFSMTKIWAAAFWGEPHQVASGGSSEQGRPELAERAAVPPPPHEAGGAVAVQLRPPRLMLYATGALVALSLVIAAAAAPLYALSTRAAADLLDTSAYRRAVLGDVAGRP